MSLELELIDPKTEILRFYKNSVESLNSGMPEFIIKERKNALKKFERAGIPTQKVEDYRYTLLDPVFHKDYNTVFEPESITLDIDEIFKCDIPELGVTNYIVVNGKYYGEKALEKLPNGVIIGSFREAAKQYPELVGQYYQKGANKIDDALVSMNTAFTNDGVFMYIPKGINHETPCQIINLAISDENLMIFNRNLIILEENSQANLVICDHTLSESDFLSNSVTELFTGQNANLYLTRMQNEHNRAAHLNSVFVEQERNSHVSTNTITLHGGMVRNNIWVDMNGEGCENGSYGLYLVDRKQHIANHTLVTHSHPNCLSRQKFKGVLDDQATGAFNGKILVMPGAQKTEAYQANNNILLTDDAVMNTKPQLEIYADDVKCSHGATIGQLDEDALFYLRSRGINNNEARLLLMYAFADEILSEIKIQVLRERIEDLIDKRLRGELSRCNNCAIQCKY